MKLPTLPPAAHGGVSKVLLEQWFFRGRKPEVSNGNYDLALVMLSDSTKVHFGGGNAK
jgi:hypothetical protein